MENLRGIILMTLSMFGFTVTDSFHSTLSKSIPVSQLLFMFGLCGFFVFAAVIVRSGQKVFTRDWKHPLVLARNGSEAIGTAAFITALVVVPLSTASAILQATPLFVTIGAAMFLNEAVGWRRWAAIIMGFGGVLLILRPSSDGLAWEVLLVVLALIALAARDVTTRAMPGKLSTLHLAAYAFATVALTGLAMVPFGAPPHIPTPVQAGLSLASVATGTLSYYAITAAMRLGEASVITPFRYSRLIFAMSIGIFVLGERPDAMTWLGAAVIIASGLYTFARERNRRVAESFPLAK